MLPLKAGGSDWLCKKFARKHTRGFYYNLGGEGGGGRWVMRVVVGGGKHNGSAVMSSQMFVGF